MDRGFAAEKTLGYFQAAAGAVDASVTLASLITGGIPAGTTMVLITPEAQAIRFRDDGAAPTATVGFPIAVAATLRYTAGNLPSMRLISQVAGAIVNIICYGQ